MSRSDKLAIGFLVAFITLLFADVLFAARNFYFRDLTRYYYPTKKLVRETILSGQFPSWNPLFAAGQPMAANPDYSVFYPPQWLTLLPGYDFGYRLHIVFHFYVAAIGMYLLLRWWRLGVHAALFGAIAFAAGGLLLSSVNLLPILYCLTWLPAIMLAVQRGSFALASLLLAMPMLAGEPVTIAQISVLLFAVGPRRSWPRLLGIHLVAFLIASVQLIPAADHFRDSVRASGFSFDLVSTWSTPPLKLAELLLPGVMGPAGEHARFYWGTAQYGWLDPFFLSIYFGVVAIAFAVAGFVRRLPRSGLVLTLLSISIVLAIGKATPLLGLLYQAGIFSSFRFPEKFLILGIFPLTAFAAFAFDKAIRDAAIARLAMVVAGVVTAMGAVLFALSRSGAYAEAFASFWRIGIHPLAMEMADLSAATWLSILARGGAAVIAIALARRVPSAAVAVLAIDLAWQRWSVAETIDGGFFRERPALAAAVPSGERLFHQADWYGATAIARQYFDLPEMYWVIRNGLFPVTGAGWGVATVLNPDIDQTFLQPTAELNEAMWAMRERGEPRWLETMMAMTGARHRALYLPFAGGGRDVRPIIIVPVPSNGPYVFQPAGAGKVESVESSSNRVRLDVTAVSDAMLVLAVTRHKYWRATIDGREAPLVPANIAFQALRVPGGSHQIELRYRNPLFAIFGSVSIATVLVLLVMILRRDRAQLRPR